MSSGVSHGHSACVLKDYMHKIYTLKNGIRVAYERMAHTKSVSIGIFVKSGSMYETKEENGISHFIEHMLFKGTKSRSAKKIAEEMDFIGGQINAYTSRDYTCYYTKALSEDLPLCADILSDMYYNSLFKEEDIELERSVIIEEINMYEDSPEDIAIDSAFENIWKDHPLGYLISGTVKSVSGITREMMLSYMKRRYTPENTVISLVGNFEEKKMLDLLENYFCQGENSSAELWKAPLFCPGIWERKKDIEQTHIAINYPAFPLGSPKNRTLLLLNGIFGASMSSRLFQKLREENGLCYSIYSYFGTYPEAGFFGIYAGVSDEALEKAVSMIDEEIDRICKEKVSDFELQKAFAQLRCSVLMGRESTSARMSNYGKELLIRGKIQTDMKVLSYYEKITAEDIIKCANEIFDKNNRGIYILRPL